MKKLKIPTLAIILLSILIPAQLSAQSKFAGIKGGLNLASMSIEDADDKNIIPRFHAGVWGRMMINEQFGVQPEILYSARGVKAVYDADFLGFDIADGETTLDLAYIDIPIYLTYNLSEDFNFHLGPYLGILLNAKIETDAEILEFLNYNNMDDVDREEFNPLDFGISGGLGFTIDPVNFGFNYNLGLRQAAKAGSNMEDHINDAKNNNIQVYVGLVF